MNTEYWYSLGQEFSEDYTDTEEAFAAAKSIDSVWSAWNKLTSDEQETAADAFAEGMLEAPKATEDDKQ